MSQKKINIEHLFYHVYFTSKHLLYIYTMNEQVPHKSNKLFLIKLYLCPLRLASSKGLI